MIPEKCRLLHGPYHAPSLHRGDRTLKIFVLCQGNTDELLQLFVTQQFPPGQIGQ